MKSVVKKYSFKLGVLLFLNIVINGFLLLSILNLGVIVQRLQEQDFNKFLINVYAEITILGLWKLIFTPLYGLLKVHLEKKLTLDLQQYFLTNIENIKNQNNTLEAGKITSIIFNTIPEIIDKRIMTVIGIVSDVLSFIAIVVIGSLYFWGLGIFILGAGIISTVIILLISKRLAKVEKAITSNNTNSNNRFTKLINTYDKLFFLNKMSTLNSLIGSENNSLTQKQFKNDFKKEMIYLPIYTIRLAVAFITLIVVNIFYFENLVSLQTLFSVPILFGHLAFVTSQIMTELGNFIAYKQIFKKYLPKPVAKHQFKNLTIEKITFKNFNVSFKDHKLYPQNLNLTFKRGQNYLIVGPSGSGKSSIFRSIFDQDLTFEGQIYLNDQLIDDIAIKDIYQALAFVENDSQIFQGTVKDNITLLRPVSDKNLKKALKLAHLEPSYLTKDALTLSEGEKQRVALASYLINKPQWIILDEGLANLDKQTMNDILKGIIKANINLINISHSPKISQETYGQKIDLKA